MLASRDPLSFRPRRVLVAGTSALRTRHKLDDRVPEALAANPHLVGVRLRTPGEVDAWVEQLAWPAGGPDEPGVPTSG